MVMILEMYSKIEEHLLGYNSVWPVEYRPKFRKNISPPSSLLNNKKAPLVTCLMILSYLAFIHPEYGGLTSIGIHGVISQKTILRF